MKTERKNRKPNALLVTGGSGFIGSNFIRFVFNHTKYSGKIINLDKLTYAGNPDNLTEIDKKFSASRYFFEYGDICDFKCVEQVISNHTIDMVIHFAAESHVDRSIIGPGEFIQTNVIGTFSLLEAVRKYWQNREDVLFHHVSTDEVFGSLGEEGYFYENTPYNPRSPYSASKASADHLVRAYGHTYNLPVTLSNCSNNYGPYQFPEKLIPLMILNALDRQILPVYGEGKNVRDWLFVDDHCAAIWKILMNGRVGETYNIGGENEKQNIEIVHNICDILGEVAPLKNGSDYKDLISFVTDRPGHDWRYAISCEKIKQELDWRPITSFDKGLRKTIDWYLSNRKWVERVRSGEYQKWIETHYRKSRK